MSQFWGDITHREKERDRDRDREILKSFLEVEFRYLPYPKDKPRDDIKH